MDDEINDEDIDKLHEIIHRFVLSIPDKLDRSIFWFYVFHGETVEELSERFGFDEEIIVEILYDCQDRARKLSEIGEDEGDE